MYINTAHDGVRLHYRGLGRASTSQFGIGCITTATGPPPDPAPKTNYICSLAAQPAQRLQRDYQPNHWVSISHYLDYDYKSKPGNLNADIFNTFNLELCTL